MSMFGLGESTSVFDTDSVNESAEMTMEQMLLEMDLMAMAELNPVFMENWAASDEAEALCEAGLINRRTIVKLNKNDDLQRRVKMAAFEEAKNRKDPLWEKLRLNREKERMLISQLMKKYSSVAQRNAKNQQREYMKHPIIKKLAATFANAEEKK